MIKRNFVVLDTETSGLDPRVGSEVVHLYASAYNFYNLEQHYAKNFEVKIKPQHPEKASPGALAVIGPLWDDAIKNGVSQKIAWTKFYEWALKVNDKSGSNYTKPVFWSHNKDFDQKFVEHHLLENKIVKMNDEGEIDWPWSFWFDSLTITYSIFESSLDNIKLDSLLNVLNIKRANIYQHTASEDVELLAQAIIRMIKYLRECGKRMTINQ